MKEKQPLMIGQRIDDLICIGKESDCKKKTTYKYRMKCQTCGREKLMLSSTIRRHSGTTHKACGKGLKTKDPIFYSRWKAMRTRTTNQKYQASQRYYERNINSDEFRYFIDFYDAMYESYRKVAMKIGKHNTSLERINNNESYTKSNCTWIHVNKQQSNQERIVKFEVTFPDGHKEQTKNVHKFAQDHNLDNSTILDCLNPKRATKSHKGYKFKLL